MRNLCIEERKRCTAGLLGTLLNDVGDYGGYVGHVKVGLR